MANFIFLYRATPEANQQHMGTPEAARASMQAFTTWVAELERKGHLVDPGQPLDRRGAVVKGKDLIGFSLIRADNLKQATVLAESCPMLQGEASVEVRPIAEVNF